MSARRLGPVTLREPTFQAAHGVLQLPNPISRDPSRDEIFVAAVRDSFPNVISRQVVPPEVPLLAPHLTLSSTSSQLAVSAVQADFEVRFYGEYPADLNRCLEYVERKMLSILGGFSALDVVPSMVGLIGTLHFSFEGLAEEPAAHILSTHLRTDVDPDGVQDAIARLALKVRDTYFVNMTVGNYESRVFERPMLAGVNQIRVRPWEGRVDDYGLELTLDINNNLEGRVKREDPEVTDAGVQAVVRLMREVALTTGPSFAETGSVSIDDLTTASIKT
jgi:hypothetical protein